MIKSLALAAAATLFSTCADAQVAMTVNGTSGPVTVAPAIPLMVAITNGPGNYNDLVWVHTPSTWAWYEFAYLGSGDHNIPGAGKTNGAVTLPPPPDIGSYLVDFQTGGTNGPTVISTPLTVASAPPPTVAGACPAGEFVNNTQAPLNCGAIQTLVLTPPATPCPYNASALEAPSGFTPQPGNNGVVIWFCMPDGIWRATQIVTVTAPAPAAAPAPAMAR